MRPFPIPDKEKKHRDLKFQIDPVPSLFQILPSQQST